MEPNTNFDYNLNQNDKVVTLGDWIVTFILQAIPVVNIVMLFVWAFSSTTPDSKKNYARAALIFVAIGIVLSIIFSGAILAALSSAANY